MKSARTVALALAAFSAAAALTIATTADAQQPGSQQPRQARTWTSDPRAQDRTYHFADTDEDLPYCVYASTKISPDTPAPLVISLHGLGAPPAIMCNTTAVDLAEEGGYILAAPMGYNVSGWYGSPTPRRREGAPQRPGSGQGPGAGQAQRPGGPPGLGAPPPENLAELSEEDVMNVLAMMRAEFNVDPNRIYLTGHSMGGAGTLFLGSKHADIWAAIAAVAPAAFGMADDAAAYLQPLKDAGVPVLVVHGDADEVVPVQNSRDWITAMDEVGVEHEYLELPGISHGPVITASQQGVFEFFGMHAK